MYVMYTYNISSALVRSWFLWLKIKKILREKELSITELAEKSWVSRPTLTNVFNWKKAWSDDLFKKVMEAIWLTSIEIKKIFQEADLEEYKYKYWEEIDLIPQADLEIIPNTEKIKLEIMDELGEEFIKELSLSRKFRNNDTLIDEAREIWNFMKNEASRIKKEKK